MLKCVELMMHNGVNPVNGEQLGPKTGELSELNTLEKLQKALYTQIDYFMDLMIRGFNIVGSLHAVRQPVVFIVHARQRLRGEGQGPAVRRRPLQ